jgi:hypothetical protein
MDTKPKKYVLYLRTGEGPLRWSDDAKPTYLIKPRDEYDQMLTLKGGSKDGFTRKILAESDDKAELERFVNLIEEGA